MCRCISCNGNYPRCTAACRRDSSPICCWCYERVVGAANCVTRKLRVWLPAVTVTSPFRVDVVGFCCAVSLKPFAVVSKVSHDGLDTVACAFEVTVTVLCVPPVAGTLFQSVDGDIVSVVAPANCETVKLLERFSAVTVTVPLRGDVVVFC